MGISGHCRRISLATLHRLQQCQDEAEMVQVLYPATMEQDAEDVFWSEKWIWRIQHAGTANEVPASPDIFHMSESGSPVNDIWFGFGFARYLVPHEISALVDQLHRAGWNNGRNHHGGTWDDYETYDPSIDASEPGLATDNPFPPDDLTELPHALSLYELESCMQLITLLESALQADEAIVFWVG